MKLTKKHSTIFMVTMVLLSLGFVSATTQSVIGEETTIEVNSICWGSLFDQPKLDDEWIARGDSDGSDGYVLYFYGTYAIHNGDEVIQQGDLQQLVNAEYTEQVTFTPDSKGSYTITPVILYIEQEYNDVTDQWETISSGTCGDNNTELVEVFYPNPDQNSILTLIQQIFQSWLDQLGDL